MTAVDAAEQALKAARLDLANALSALDAALTQEAAYVQDVTGGDAIKIATTNMPRRPSLPIGPLDRVLDLVVKAGVNEGGLQGELEEAARGRVLRSAGEPGPVHNDHLAGRGAEFQGAHGDPGADAGREDVGTRARHRQR